LPVATSEAFKMKDGGVSVLLGRIVRDERRTPESLIADFDGYGLMSLSEAEIRAIDGLTVEPDPKADERAHANIRGLRKQTPKRLRDIATWEIPVPR
jgi:hypothetical protein